MQKNPLFSEAVDEEDPKVIKELIDLIKKLGGIEQLERQLNNDATNTKSNTESKPTNQPAISKALYQKVLSGAVSGRSFVPRNRYSFSTQRNATKSAAADGGVVVQGSVGANKYSSVIRNSRPEPQSAGVEALGDNQRVSVGAERPQYVTIRRPSVSPATKYSDEDELEDDDDEEDVVEEDDAVIVPARRSTTTSSPKYVNIQRRRGSTTEKPSPAEEENVDDDDDDDAEDVPVKSKYSTFNRKQVQSADKGDTTGGIR